MKLPTAPPAMAARAHSPRGWETHLRFTASTSSANITTVITTKNHRCPSKREKDIPVLRT